MLKIATVRFPCPVRILESCCTNAGNCFLNLFFSLFLHLNASSDKKKKKTPAEKERAREKTSEIPTCGKKKIVF